MEAPTLSSTPTGHAQGQGIPAAARPGTADDGRKKHKAGERLVSAAFEFTTLHGVSAKDGQSDEEEEAGSKQHKKRVIPESVRSAIETVKMLPMDRILPEF